MMKIELKILFTLTGLLLSMIQPVDGGNIEGRLRGIKKRITRQKEGITKVERKEDSMLHALAKIDDQLDRRNKMMKAIGSRLDAIIGDLQKTEQKLIRVRRSLKERRELFRKRAQALYRWQRGGSPFILLNGEISVGALMRRKHYLEIMLAQDHVLLAALLLDSVHQQTLKKELSVNRENLDKERMTLIRAKESIRRERQKKGVILARLRGEKKVRIRALKELEQAARRLQKMVEEIGRQMTARPTKAYPWAGFAALRGQLEYPIEGKIVGAFGMTKHPEFSANLFRKGIDIEALFGEEIKTVEKGKVVFADRFSGYGKMMIIDHGKRYYTVYAHLSELLKGSGDTVQKGEPIALVGDSGFLKGARLYFEIRKDGKPLDPIPWFKKR